MTLDNKLIEIAKTHEEAINKSAPNPFKDKWISIIGDDICTYKGFNPEGNATYYPNDGYGKVDDVKKTWWHILLKRLGAKLCVNNSRCGRKISDITNEADSGNPSLKVWRSRDETYINLDGEPEVATDTIYPDVILMMVGANDFNDGATLGEFNYSPSVYTAGDTFNHNFSRYLSCIVRNSGRSQVFVIDFTYNKRFEFFEPNKENGSTLGQFQEAIDKQAKLFQVNCIHISKIGVNYHDDHLFINEDKMPTDNLMERIANQCYSEMMANCNLPCKL